MLENFHCTFNEMDPPIFKLTTKVHVLRGHDTTKKKEPDHVLGGKLAKGKDRAELVGA